MANEKIRVVNIHRTQKYNTQFIQVDYNNLGIVFGKLTKDGAKNLYLYFMSNKDDYPFQLIASNYANWLGKSYSKDGKIFDESTRSTINKQIREGLKQLLEEGYLVEVIKDVSFEFYEYGTKSSESDKKLYVEQKVIEDTESSENNKKLYAEQKVTYETDGSGFIF